MMALVQVSRKQWLVTAAVAGWALVLVVAAVWSAHHDEPTVREQSSLASGRDAVERAVAAVADAAGPRATVDVHSSQERAGCRITLADDGTELDRTVVIQVPEGQERATLTHLAEELPDAWQARYYPALDHFFADAGEFVAVRGGVHREGEIRLTAATGCRPD